MLVVAVVMTNGSFVELLVEIRDLHPEFSVRWVFFLKLLSPLITNFERLFAPIQLPFFA
jgi:hypothetical protein